MRLADQGGAVSAGQVNALLPSTIATGGLLQLTVSNGAEASNVLASR
jgi:hypothetical protein